MTELSSSVEGFISCFAYIYEMQWVTSILWKRFTQTSFSPLSLLSWRNGNRHTSSDKVQWFSIPSPSEAFDQIQEVISSFLLFLPLASKSGYLFCWWELLRWFVGGHKFTIMAVYLSKANLKCWKNSHPKNYWLTFQFMSFRSK